MTHADAGRRITALAAGGSVLLLSATAVALWPRTYGTAATFVIDGGSHVGNPVALAGRIEAGLLEREALATVAMDLPPELRSPDPIGRLRAGIRVQSRGAMGFSVEFRGSDPQSVQRIANHLADLALKLLPKLARSPADNAPALALAERSRAVTEFLNAHPEITLEPSSQGKSNPAADSGLDALRNEKRKIEQRLASGATDNPYADPAQDPDLLNRRLVELRTTIARRETSLQQPRPASPPAVPPELTSRWRALLAELAAAQASSSVVAPAPTVSGHVTARAPLPTSPLTPNRLVLSIVAALLSMAAAMVAYVLPRKAESAKRRATRSTPPGPRSEPPPPLLTAAPPQHSEPAVPANSSIRSDQPLPRSDPPPKGSDPPPPGRPGSEPPGPIAVQRTVVLSGHSGSSAGTTPKRSRTSPGGLQAPDLPTTAADSVPAPPPTPYYPPAASLFGSRPPPGAGSYSVSSSHPPPMGPNIGTKRTSVERLSPLQSAHPPASHGPATVRPLPAVVTTEAPQIVSRPPALDPEAETWAARFDTVPPPAPTSEDAPRKRSGRWKTQVMGSMVSLDVTAAREERRPASEPESFRPQSALYAEVMPAAPPPPAVPAPARAPAAALPLLHHDVPASWSPKLPPELPPELASLRDAVLEQLTSRRLSIAVTGAAGDTRAQVAAMLALSLAHRGARVLLVEADFDRPELHETLAISAPHGAGFSQQLRNHGPGASPQPWAVVRCSPSLHVLVEGRLRSPGMLASGAFEGALQHLKEHHHVVVVHAPPLNRPGDLRSLTSLVQGVVVANVAQPPSIEFGDGALRALLI